MYYRLWCDLTRVQIGVLRARDSSSHLSPDVKHDITGRVDVVVRVHTRPVSSGVAWEWWVPGHTPYAMLQRN